MARLVIPMVGLLFLHPQDEGDPFRGLWKPIDLESKAIDTREALESVFKQSGQSLAIWDEMPEKKIDLSLKKATYWQALDEILRLHGGVRYDDRYERGLEAGPWTERPAVYKGPFKISIYDLARVKETRYPERLDRTEAAVSVRWTPDIHIARNDQLETGKARITRADDDTGRSLLPLVDAGENYEFAAMDRHNTEGRWIFRLQPPSKAAKAIALLEGEWEGTCLVDIDQVTFEKPEESVGQERRVGPMKLILASCKVDDNPIKKDRTHYTVTFNLVYDPANAPADWKEGLKTVPLGMRVPSKVSMSVTPGQAEALLMWDRDAKKGNEAQFWGTMRGDGGPLKAVVVPVAKNIRAVRAPFAFKNVPLPGEKP